MSAGTEEVLDLQQVTDVVAPDKVKPAAKKATPPPKRQPKSREEIRAEMEEDLVNEEAIRAEIRAELEIEYAARRADASVDGVEETPYVHVTPNDGEEVIHFVEDGLTFGNKVYMRGEELALDPQDHPWIKFSRTQQIKKYGKSLFAQGPWPYGGYDLTDESLSDQDKKRLLDLTTDDNFG